MKGDLRRSHTLDGLIPFTKCWPALDSLAISLQADTNVSPVQRPAGRSCCPNLKTLQVAALREEWIEVRDLLATFADVRKQEKVMES